MNDSTEIPDECPVCGSDEVEGNIGFEVGLCDNCGYVINQSSNKNQPSEISRSTVQKETEPPNEWQDSVDVEDSSDENLVQLVDRTNSIAEELLLTDAVKLQAAEFSTDAWVERIPHGRSTDIVAAASVGLACRLAQKARPKSVIAQSANVRSTTLHSTMNTLADEFDIDHDVSPPQDYISFIRKQVGRNSGEDTTARHRLDQIEELPSGDPAGIAAASVYLELNTEDASVTFREIADTVGLTKETIWRRAEDLRNLETR